MRLTGDHRGPAAALWPATSAPDTPTRRDQATRQGGRGRPARNRGLVQTDRETIDWQGREPDTAPAAALRVATWNIRKAVGLDRRRDPARVIAAIADLRADIVALQEADLRLGARPAALPAAEVEAVTGMAVVDVGGNPGSLGVHGNALLVRRDLLVRAAAAIELPALEPRGAITAEIAVPGLEARVRVVATHLGLLRAWRRRQLATIRTGLDAAALPNTLILGDFNEWSTVRGLEALAPDFAVLAPGASFHAARPLAPLDRIAHGRGLHAFGAGVVREGPSRIASDHLPVWAEFAPALMPDASDHPAPAARPAPPRSRLRRLRRA